MPIGRSSLRPPGPFWSIKKEESDMNASKTIVIASVLVAAFGWSIETAVLDASQSES